MSMPVQSTTPPQSSRPALRSGAIMGFALGAIHSTIIIITSQLSGSFSNRLATILYLVLPLIWIIGLLIAGAWGSLTTGKVSTGSLAGVFAGTFGGILAAFGHVIAAALTISQSNDASVNNLAFLGGFAAIFYVIVLAIGVGAGAGALGGLIGQSMSGVRPQPQPVYIPPTPPYNYPTSQQPLRPRDPEFPPQE